MQQYRHDAPWPGWETVGLLGNGPNSTVYEIRSSGSGAPERAAMKVLSITPDTGEGGTDAALQHHLRSAVAEFSWLRQLGTGPNVLRCDDLHYVRREEDSGWDLYFRMEALTPLISAFPSGVSEEAALRMARDICRALEKFEELGIAHRNIKPQNIFLTPEGDFKLGEYNILRTLEAHGAASEGAAFRYTAPETGMNRPQGPGADLYSLGLVLYWLMNSRRMPFLPLPPARITPEALADAERRRLAGESLPEPAFGSSGLKAIVRRACAFEPEERYQSAREMLAELNALGPSSGTFLPGPAGEKTTAAPVTRPVAPPVRQNPPVRPVAPPVRQNPPVRPATPPVRQNPPVRPAAQPRQNSLAGGANVPQTRQYPVTQQKPKRPLALIIGLCLLCAALLCAGGIFLISHLGEGESIRETEDFGHNVQTPQTRPSETQPPVQDNNREPEAITLKVWAPLEDQVDANSWLIQVQAQFEAAHPEYRITWENGVCVEGDAAVMVTADPAAAADVYMFANDQLGTLLQAGALAQLGGSYLEQVRNDVSATYLNTVTATDGNVYGFPVAPNTWFMYYNKAILSEEDVKSMEACLRKGVVAFEVKNPWYLPAFFFAAGGTLFGETGADAAAGVQFGGQVGINATNAVLDLLENPNFRVDGDGYGYAGLKDGTVAAYFSGSWDYTGLYEALGDKLGAVPAPTVMINGEAKQLKAYAGSKVVGVNPNCKHMKAAMEFASFLASADSQLLRFQLRNITPAVTALANHPEVAASIVAAAEAATMTYASVAQPTIREMYPVWGPIGTYGANLADGTINRSNVAEMVDLLDGQLNGG